ncbi:MAG: pilus (MSHA type) biogenesis protein MshL [Desulfobulbaceae bacterium]|uniref:Pilus (MSHA type) biogenesis protein MshL n=1 Tax=Candidatus Desulfatifera sulfidica TaxID=2841691 RepID=A0A8J6NC00_9BACT|nr:pilus (MSHA type) biogenesis protein MshL [Candidatus Desulfatifera sulfidica]
MKLIIQLARLTGLLALVFFCTSCAQYTQQADQSLPEIETATTTLPSPPVTPPAEQRLTLPVQYQRSAYIVGQGAKEALAAKDLDVVIKVGATISTTQGPQPLWDIMKRLASLKNMNISWASDVDQNVLVDVDINANDDYYNAIDNLLRQVDYFHEMRGSTIVIKYKETRQLHIAMPFTKQTYETGTGGNILGGSTESGNIDGTIRINSQGNEFDIWKNIQENLDAILATWSTSASTAISVAPEASTTDTATTSAPAATRQISASGNRYTIDKPVGLITVHAPRPLLDRIETYIDNLKKELYKQISIEAKIIEVALTDNSSLGINWNNVLKNFQLAGSVEFGTNGELWSTENGGSRFVSKLTLGDAGFSVFLNALNEEGNAKVLSNPKISVLNGQPAMISVGRNVTYIDKIESDADTDTGVITYTVDTERILSGLGLALTANILNQNEIILNLVPVTSELLEPIEYRQVGSFGTEVGLPIVNVREMSTTVKVKDGEMLVIGGLISNTTQSDENFAPGLGDIPFFKYLFGYEEKVSEKRELIILLRPRII